MTPRHNIQDSHQIACPEIDHINYPADIAVKQDVTKRKSFAGVRTSRTHSALYSYVLRFVCTYITIPFHTTVYIYVEKIRCDGVGLLLFTRYPVVVVSKAPPPCSTFKAPATDHAHMHTYIHMLIPHGNTGDPTCHLQVDILRNESLAKDKALQKERMAHRQVL